jgi:hypothetical protein
MKRGNDSTQIDHPRLREFAVEASWVAKLEEAVGVLEELVVDLGDEEQPDNFAAGTAIRSRLCCRW